MDSMAIPGVCERDIDFLLQEELASSPAFLDWFVKQAGASAPSALVNIAHSVSTSTGESDIVVTVKCGEQTHMYLVENKVDAPLRPRQPERYRERAERYVQENQCSAGRTVLVAPKKYLGEEPDSLGFDSTITYEDLLEWFGSCDLPPGRASFKRALLKRGDRQGVNRLEARAGLDDDRVLTSIL